MLDILINHWLQHEQNQQKGKKKRKKKGEIIKNMEFP